MTVVTRLRCNACGAEIPWERDERSAPAGWLVIGRTNEDEIVHVVHLCSFTCLHAWADQGR